jgi:type IX secretion system PorP/SprF family membrane protein
MGYGPDYQTVIMVNPAFSGSESDGIMRVSYMNFYPGNGYNLHSVYMSYDAFFPAIHGGAGLYLSDDYLGGIVNDTRGGITYSYHLQAGKKVFINGGLMASFYHRGYNFRNSVLPDQIDPYGNISLPPGEILGNRGKTVFDIGTGFLLMAGRIFAGVSAIHLAAPDPESSGSVDSRLKRKYHINIAGEFPVGREKNSALRPMIFFEKQGDITSFGSGGVWENRLLSFSSVMIFRNNHNIDNQSGFTVRTGTVTFFYNYRFNLSSRVDMLPFSLLHQTGLTLRLQAVDKRNTIKTINYPKM